MARDRGGQIADLRAVAALDEARALAALATLRAKIEALRQAHAALGKEVAVARRAASADPQAGLAAERLRRWAEQRQAALNLQLAQLHIAQEHAARRAQRAVGRNDALSRLARDLAQERVRLAQSRREAQAPSAASRQGVEG